LDLRVRGRTAELQSTNKKLEAEIRERQQTEESLRELSGRILQLQDEEQRRIGRELHDSTVQTLSALAIDLERAQQLIPGGRSEVRRLLGESAELVERATSEVRTISYLLHPPILDDLGLEDAIQWYAAGFSRRSGIEVNVDLQQDLGRFPRELELTLFRIVQEALTNIHRHSGSPTAQITLSKDAGRVTLQMTDHGSGMRPETLDAIRKARAIVGVGIAGMRERVRQLGGQFEIGGDSNGTLIRVVLPINGINPSAGKTKPNDGLTAE
jgi:signal transduction histidine kinase